MTREQCYDAENGKNSRENEENSAKTDDSVRQNFFRFPFLRLNIPPCQQNVETKIGLAQTKPVTKKWLTRNLNSLTKFSLDCDLLNKIVLTQLNFINVKNFYDEIIFYKKTMSSTTNQAADTLYQSFRECILIDLGKIRAFNI